jgi:hypothetical protein
MPGGETTLYSWQVLDPIALAPRGAIAERFLRVGISNYREAARYVSALSYGRNSRPSDPFIVLDENRGTCATKHVLLRRLAIEQDLNVALRIGIYEMNGRNTPGVGRVLERHNLVCLPEAHCYLWSKSRRVDLTYPTDAVKPEPIFRFLHEEEINPDQAGAHKKALHQRFLRRWMEEGGVPSAHSFEQLWEIREQCIAALSGSSGTKPT